MMSVSAFIAPARPQFIIYVFDGCCFTQRLRCSKKEGVMNRITLALIVLFTQAFCSS